MKWFLRAFFVLIIANIIAGYVIRQKDMALGEKWIGLSVATGFFVYMPIFLVHRWKGKQLKDYTLSPENLKKMKETLEPTKTTKKNNTSNGYFDKLSTNSTSSAPKSSICAYL
jgi:hypothetical protein